MTILAQSDNLLARSMSPSESSQCVITFSSYTDHRTTDRIGFAQEFLESEQINAVHIICRDNDWYLYPELNGIAEQVRAHTKNYSRVFSYGSSMGGYAAVRHGKRFGADTAIAISPQYSLNPSVAPFEYRWSEAQHLDFSQESDVSGYAKTSYIFYDPFDIDRRHVNLFRKHTDVIDVKVPFASHPVGGFLSEIGLLKGAILDILNDRFDPNQMLSSARVARANSIEYLFALSKRTRSNKWKIELSRRVVERAPDHALFRAHHAQLLGEQGRWTEAEAQIRVILNELPFSVPAHLKLATFYSSKGDYDKAVEILEQVVSREPDVADFRARLETAITYRQSKSIERSVRDDTHAFKRLLLQFNQRIRSLASAKPR